MKSLRKPVVPEMDRRFVAIVVLLGLAAQMDVSRPVNATEHGTSALTAPVRSVPTVPQVSYNDPTRPPFQIVGVTPGKIDVDAHRSSNRSLRVTFHTLLPDRKMAALVHYYSGTTLTRTIPGIECGTYAEPVNFRSCSLALDNLQSGDTHVRVHIASEDKANPVVEARFDVPINVVWPTVPPSASGVSREHGARDDKRDSPILLDVQPRELSYVAPIGSKTLTVRFWTRFPNERVRTQIGIVKKVGANGALQNSRTDHPAQGNCDREYATPGVHSCELTIDMALASSSDLPILVFLSNGTGQRYYAPVKVGRLADRVAVQSPSSVPPLLPGDGRVQAPAPVKPTPPQPQVLITPKAERPAQGNAGGARMMNPVRVSPATGYRSQVVATEGACKALCTGEAQCRAWTWVTAEKRCWLKSSVPVASTHACCTSGVK